MPGVDKWPRLTVTLTGPEKAGLCRSCGEIADDLWQECGDRDQPEHRYFWLCRKCGDRLIEAHPRLYTGLHTNAPAPGAMALCDDCPHRQPGGVCGCPQAKVNGGPGVLIQTVGALTMFIDGQDKTGRRWGKRMTSYSMPPAACSGKNPTPFDPA